MLKLKLSKDITNTLINISGDLKDGGFVKYNQNDRAFQTILPDENLDKQSENIVKNKAISLKFEHVEKRIDDVEAEAGKYATTDEVQSLGARVTSLTNDLSTTNNNVNTLSEGLQETDNKVTEIENDLDAHEQSSTQQFNTINGKITDLEQAISEKEGIKVIIVDLLPTENIEKNAIYFVPSITATEKNFYYEYMYINNNWEMIGTTEVDLSSYVTKEEYNTRKGEVNTAIQDLSSSLEETNDEVENIKDNLIDVVDNLDSTSVEDALSANQGRVLNEKIKDIELFKFPNVNIHGEPTINNGQVSGFSNINYLSLPAIFELHDRGFEFNFGFRTNSDITTAQNILGSRFCMALLVEGGKIKLKVSSNGSNWDLVDIEGDLQLQPNTNYYIQINYNKLTYKLRYSLDGIEYNDIGSRVASTSPYPAQIYLGIGNNFFNPFKGMINLNKCNLKVNNSIVWQGMDDAGLATRADVSLSNIDSAGVDKITEIAKAYVDSLNAQEVEY